MPIAVAQVAAQEEVDPDRGWRIAISSASSRWTAAFDPYAGHCRSRWRRNAVVKRRVFVPGGERARSGRSSKGVDVYGVRSLREVFEFLRGGENAPSLRPTREDAEKFFSAHQAPRGGFFGGPGTTPCPARHGNRGGRARTTLS